MNPLPAVTIEKGCAVVCVDRSVFNDETVLKAAHAFTDRCYVEVASDPADPAVTRCTIRPKRSLDNIELLARDFLNEVLDFELRARIAQRTAPVRDLLLAQAFSRLNLFHPELDTAQPESDPCGIARADR